MSTQARWPAEAAASGGPTSFPALNLHPSGIDLVMKMTRKKRRPTDRSDHVGRARVVAADLATAQGSRIHVRVVLERGGREYVTELSGIGEETLLLRLAAEATIDALARLIGDSDRFELVGIKRVAAFDAQVILACVRPSSDRSQRLIGCVPSPENLVHGVATAVLHATNRLVERLPEPASKPS